MHAPKIDQKELLGGELFDSYEKFVNMGFEYNTADALYNDYDNLVNAIAHRLVTLKRFDAVHHFADPLILAKADYLLKLAELPKSKLEQVIQRLSAKHANI